jgi:hypothetical protein
MWWWLCWWLFWWAVLVTMLVAVLVVVLVVDVRPFWSKSKQHLVFLAIFSFFFFFVHNRDFVFCFAFDSNKEKFSALFALLGTNNKRSSVGFWCFKHTHPPLNSNPVKGFKTFDDYFFLWKCAGRKPKPFGHLFRSRVTSGWEGRGLVEVRCGNCKYDGAWQCNNGSGVWWWSRSGVTFPKCAIFAPLSPVWNVFAREGCDDEDELETEIWVRGTWSFLKLFRGTLKYSSKVWRHSWSEWILSNACCKHNANDPMKDRWLDEIQEVDFGCFNVAVFSDSHPLWVKLSWVRKTPFGIDEAEPETSREVSRWFWRGGGGASNLLKLELEQQLARPPWLSSMLGVRDSRISRPTA